MKYILSIFFALLLFPHITWAQVRINEVAWMGTADSQYSEWIELYNESNTAIDLAGWKLYEAGSTVVFTFTKTIDAGEYLVLERVTASAPDALPGIDDEAGSFGGSGLANTGEVLTIKDDNGESIESLDFSSGWPAGDAATKETMQYADGDWITAAPTPKAATAGDQNLDDTTDQKSIKKSTTTLDTDPIPKVSPNAPHIAFTTPATIYRGVPYQYEAQPVFEYNYRIENGSFTWNMGDGTVFRFDQRTPVTHTYQYPGTYTISFLYTDPTNTNLPLKGTKKIQVGTPEVGIAVIDGSALEIKNTSPTAVDLSGWSIASAGRRVQIPDMTTVAEKATIAIPFSVLSIPASKDLSIINPSGGIVASTVGRTGTTAGTQTTVSYQSPSDVFEIPQALASATPIFDTEQTQEPPIRNRTKAYIFGAVALFVIGLSILLERFMARQEYSS